MRSRTLAVAGLAAAAIGLAPAVAGAAAPDGAAGPWADTVVASQQGTRGNGTAIPVTRRNPSAALGVAEDTNAEGTFFSLGFRLGQTSGGSLTVGFDNLVCNGDGNDLRLREATNERYPSELVDVYVSDNNAAFVLAAALVNKDAEVAIPDGISEVRFVRLVDRTRLGDHTSTQRRTADAYDVDGIQALHTAPPTPPATPPATAPESCTPPPPPEECEDDDEGSDGDDSSDDGGRSGDDSSDDDDACDDDSDDGDTDDGGDSSDD